MIIVGLHGPYGSGKDTAFEVIQEWASDRGVLAVRRGFADLLKLSAARVFFPDADLETALHWANEFKHRGKVICGPAPPSDETNFTDPNYIETIPMAHLSGRELLQRYGTECHREVFGDNFWVDALLPLDELQRVRAITKFMRENGDTRLPAICGVTDLRFENEAERIRDIGGMCWRIDPGDRLQQNDGHISEKQLPPHMIDVVVPNHRSLDDFKRTVWECCDIYLSEPLEALIQQGTKNERDIRGGDSC